VEKSAFSGQPKWNERLSLWISMWKSYAKAGGGFALSKPIHFPESNRKLKAQAGWMRKHQTEAEGKLWREMYRQGMGGEVWRRYAMHGYIADFWFPRFQLVVEIDGLRHDRKADRARDAALAEEGVETLRIPDWMVNEDVGHAVHLVWLELRRLSTEKPRALHY